MIAIDALLVINQLNEMAGEQEPLDELAPDLACDARVLASLAADGALELKIDAAFRPFWSSAHWRAKIWQDLGTHPSDIRIRTDAPKVTAVIDGDAMPVVREGHTVWVLDPYARLPRVRDRVGSNRPTNLGRLFVSRKTKNYYLLG